MPLLETKNDAFEFINANKSCGHCGKPTKLRCSQCQLIYYCMSEHQFANCKHHTKFCSLITEDAQNTTKNLIQSIISSRKISDFDRNSQISPGICRNFPKCLRICPKHDFRRITLLSSFHHFNSSPR